MWWEGNPGSREERDETDDKRETTPNTEDLEAMANSDDEARVCPPPFFIPVVVYCFVLSFAHFSCFLGMAESQAPNSWGAAG